MPNTLHEERFVPAGEHPYARGVIGGAALDGMSTHPYPDAPPDLHEIMPTPTIMDLAEGLHKRTFMLRDGLERESGRGDLDPLTTEVLASGDYSPQQLQEFAHNAFAWQNELANQRHRRGRPAPGSFGPILHALRAAPVDKLILAYRLDQQSSQEMQSMVERTGAAGDVREPLNFCQALYGCNDALELAAPGSHAQQDPVVRKLLGNRDAVNELVRGMQEELVPADIAQQELKARRAANATTRNWEDRFLRDVVKLPENLRTELEQASRRRTADNDDRMVDRGRLGTMLAKTWSNIRHIGMRERDRLRSHGRPVGDVDLLELGSERAAALREHAGIVNFDNRSPRQLELMSRLIRGDQEIIDHLRKGDVTVIFSDELGDHNGMARDAHEGYETEDGRTLTFGITSRDDFRKHKELLSRLGIKPSTIVIAAHGDSDGIGFGIGKDRFTLTNEHAPSFTTPDAMPKDKMYLDFADDLLELISEGMQDSKGIDDNIEAKGRRRVVLHSCLQGAPSLATRYAHRRVPGRAEPQTIPFKTSDNMAEDLIRVLGNDPRLDVITGDAVQAIVRTRYGVEFWHGLSLAESMDDDIPVPTTEDGYTPMEANRYYYDTAAGRVRSEGMDEVRMRAQPDTSIPEHQPREIPSYPSFYDRLDD